MAVGFWRSGERAGAGYPTSYDSAVNKAILLDRDGTLIRDHPYLADPELVELERGALAALQRLQRAGYLLVLATNQSGIGRGLYGEREFEAVQARLDGLLAAGGVALARVYHCPHHPTEAHGALRVSCACRKPAPGMLERAVRELDLERERCVMVGDSLSDVGAGRAAGMATVLVRTGQGAELAERPWPAAGGPDYVADDLLDATLNFVLAREREA
jgi:D-glycero-D-manno-heptose 1,7-bisphosphate phosphatase